MIAILVVSVIILISSVYYSYTLGVYNSSLINIRGFWETDTIFNEKSGVQVFTIYIGKIINKQYSIYILIIDNDNNILVNKSSTLKLTYLKKDNTCYEFKAEFGKLKSPFLPDDMIIKYYPYSSKIILYKEDTIYGCLFKNLVLSDVDLIKDELDCKK